MVRVNAVRICYIQIVEYAYSVNKHIITAGRMKGPKRCVNNGKFLKGDMVTFFNINNSRTRIKVTRNIIPVLALNKGVSVCINGSLTANGAIISLVCIDKNKAWLTCYRVTDKCSLGVINELIRTDIAVNIACRL